MQESNAGEQQAQEDKQAREREAHLAALAEVEAWSRERREKEAAKRAARSPALTFVLDRFYPLLVFVAGVIMVGWNHQSILHYHVMFYYPIVLGPFALWGGLAALIAPDVKYHGVMRQGRVIYRAAIALSVLSIVFLIWLYAVYYRVR